MNPDSNSSGAEMAVRNFGGGSIGDNLTLLDWFAGMALQGRMSRESGGWSWSDEAVQCYDQAEAMLAERAKRGVCP